MATENVEFAILCGGSGKRMGKLTANLQKCMLKIEGRPMLEHLLEQISTVFDAAKIILLVGYDSGSIRDYFGKHYKRLQLEYTRESTEGTRLALLTAENFVEGDNFFIIPGDVIIGGAELLNITNAKQPDSLGAILLSAKREIAPTHGLAVMRIRRVLKINYPAGRFLLGRHEYVLMDIGLYSKRIFEKAKIHIASAISEVLSRSIKEGETIDGEICTTPWFHFASPEDLKTQIEF